MAAVYNGEDDSGHGSHNAPAQHGENVAQVAAQQGAQHDEQLCGSYRLVKVVGEGAYGVV